jgi:hypothetical protein
MKVSFKKRIVGVATSLTLIMAVTFAVRAWYAWSQVRQMPANLVGLVPFANETGSIAYSLAQGRGFGSPFMQETGPTAWLTPVYPGIVAGIFKVYGIRTPHAFYATVALNILFAMAACVPIFAVGRRLGGTVVAATAGWMWALLPTAIIIPFQWVWDTSLSALLAACLVWATMGVAKTSRLRGWCGYGLLWGFVMMTNPSLGAVLPFLILWAMVPIHGVTHDGGMRRFGAGVSALPLRNAAVAAGIVVLCCVPWTVRNYRAFHGWVPLRSTLPLQLWLGNNEMYDPSSTVRAVANPEREDMRRYFRQGEVAFMSTKGAEAREFIAAHPGMYAVLSLRRVAAFWTGLENPWRGFWDTESWVVRLVVATNFLTAIAAFAGVYVLWRRREAAWWMLASWLVIFPVIYYLTRTLLRYRHPLDPIVVLLAGVGITAVFRAERTSQVSDSGPGSISS